MEKKQHLYNKLKEWESNGLIKSKVVLREKLSSYYEIEKLIKEGKFCASPFKSILVAPSILETFIGYIDEGFITTPALYQESEGITFHERSKRVCSREILQIDINGKASLIIKEK